MPRCSIDRSTNFIVENESWTVVEYDYSSVPGVIYISLTEGKINSIYDDIDDDIADIDKLAQYRFEVLPLTQVFHIGETVNLMYTLSKNGYVYDKEFCENNVELITNDKTIVNDLFIAVGVGETTITARLKEHPEISQEIAITVVSADSVDITPFSAYIEGADKIRLDRTEKYSLVTPIEDFSGIQNYAIYVPIIINQDQRAEHPEYTFFDHPKIPGKLLGINLMESSLLTENMAKLQFEGLTCLVTANNKNKLGYIVLECSYIYNNNQTSVFKPIEIVPLW